MCLPLHLSKMDSSNPENQCKHSPILSKEWPGGGEGGGGGGARGSLPVEKSQSDLKKKRKKKTENLARFEVERVQLSDRDGCTC